jgi:alpha-N-arabinofuranosidase
MANIAQTVNVLQAVILTDEEKMLRTPTYHAFEMYVPFQDATYVPVQADGLPEYEAGDIAVPHLSATSAITEDGELVLALVNLHATDAIDVTAAIEGFDVGAAIGRVLAGDTTDAHNTFEHPDALKPETLDVELDDDEISLVLPARSVAVLTLTL